jgi:hypothetical protein
MSTHEQPQIYTEIDELAQIAQTVEDHAQIAEWRTEADEQRAAALRNLGGKAIGERHIDRNTGLVLTESDMEEIAEKGNDENPRGW